MPLTKTESSGRRNAPMRESKPFQKKYKSYWSKGVALTVSLLCIPILVSSDPLEKKFEKRLKILLSEKAPKHRISRFDEIIHRHALRHSIDWRLIASIIHAESSFRENAISPAGAQGLMQIMPIVAREQGVRNYHKPEVNIRIGITHFLSKMKLINGDTPIDALKLSIAAYNAGLGHLRDAQRLAIQMNKSPRKWKDVRQMLLLLQKPKYYQNAKYGYCRGYETVNYVRKVMQMYRHYRDKVPVRPAHLTHGAFPASFNTTSVDNS